MVCLHLYVCINVMSSLVCMFFILSISASWRTKVNENMLFNWTELSLYIICMQYLLTGHIIYTQFRGSTYFYLWLPEHCPGHKLHCWSDGPQGPQKKYTCDSEGNRMSDLLTTKQGIKHSTTETSCTHIAVKQFSSSSCWF